MSQASDLQKLAAWLFIKHMLTPENTASFAITTGYMPVRSSAYELQDYKDFLNGPTLAAQVHQATAKSAAPAGQGQAGFLLRLPQQALVGGLGSLEFAADADPFVLVDVVFLFDPVEHQHFAAPGDIAQSGIAHGSLLRESEKWRGGDFRPPRGPGRRPFRRPASRAWRDRGRW